jgi:REP element-mobilizing transposase RayT
MRGPTRDTVPPVSTVRNATPVRNTWGGARPGAGRPPNGERAGVSHLKRAEVTAKEPVHVTLRVQAGVRSLREPRVFAAVLAGLTAGRRRFGFRLVHFSVQRDHVHLLVEASNRRSLARGLQGLTIRVARSVNRLLGRNGRLFGDRYQARVLSSPEEVKGALAYLLLEARGERGRANGSALDRCSSAEWFDGFSFGRARATSGTVRAAAARASKEMPVVPAKSWLLSVGFKRAGLVAPSDAPARKSADDEQGSAVGRPGTSRARNPVLVNRSRT